MRRSRALMETAAALALVVALAGCGSNNPKPAPAPTKSASTSPSPSGEVAPTMPPEAKGTDEAAAKAFVRHYLTVFSYAARTGDIADMRLLSASECKACSRLISSISHTYGAGGHADGKGYEAPALRLTGQEENVDHIALRGSVIQFTQKFQEAKGAPTKQFPRGEFESVFTLVRVSDAWRMLKWERL